MQKNTTTKKQEILRDDDGFPINSKDWTHEETFQNPGRLEGIIMCEETGV